MKLIAAVLFLSSASWSAHAQLPGMGAYGQEMCDRPDLKYPRTGDPVKDKKAEAMEADMRAQKAAMCKPGGLVLSGGGKVSKPPSSPPPSPSPVSPPTSGLEELPANYTEVTTFDQAMADCKSGKSKKSQEDCDAVAAAQKDELRYRRQDKCMLIKGRESRIQMKTKDEDALDVINTNKTLMQINGGSVSDPITSKFDAAGDLVGDKWVRGDQLRHAYKERHEKRLAILEFSDRKIAAACKGV